MRSILIVLLYLLLVNFKLPAGEVTETVGPNGERPVDFSVVGFSRSDINDIKQKKLKAAILMHTSSDFSNAVIAGAKERFNLLGVEVVYISYANFDPDRQIIQIERAISLGVDIIITLIIDPISGGIALKKAVNKGVKISLLSNLPKGFLHREDYVSIVTDDLFNMGKLLAEMMGESLSGKGRVLWLYHNHNYYVTNQRDNAFKTNLNRLFPNIKIIKEIGISTPGDSRVVMYDILNKYQKIDAIYAPWDTIAEGVLDALYAANREDIKVFTIDLGHKVSLEMAISGSIIGIVSDLPYTIGYTLASTACLAHIGRDIPPFIVVPAVKVTRSNLEQMWLRAYRKKAPKEVIEALKD